MTNVSTALSCDFTCGWEVRLSLQLGLTFCSIRVLISETTYSRILTLL